MYPTTSEKKKESSDHDTVKSYLQQQRNRRLEQQKNKPVGGYVSNFTNYDDLKSDSAASAVLNRNQKQVVDVNLRKLLEDPLINETERMNAVKMRTEQIE